MSADLTSLAQRIRCITQIGLTYGKDDYDLERYAELQSIAHELLAHISQKSTDEISSFFSDEKGYPTPKVDVRGALFLEGKILLVQEKSDGNWTLPGGWADQGLTPTENVLREIYEESGFVATNPRLVALVDRSCHAYKPQYIHHLYKLFYLCDIEKAPESFDENTEIQAIGFYSLEEIPPLSEERVLREDIERLFAFYKNPELPLYQD